MQKFFDIMNKTELENVDVFVVYKQTKDSFRESINIKKVNPSLQDVPHGWTIEGVWLKDGDYQPTLPIRMV